MLISQALSLPWMAVALWSNSPALDLSPDVLVMALHWSVYGLVYGYLYTWLRGTTPVVKAMALLPVAIIAEVVPVLSYELADRNYGAQLTWSALLWPCAVLIGQSLLVCLGLGVVWERQLAVAAGPRWGQIRNLRRIASASVPAVTILVAAASAFATAVAGTLAGSLNHQASDNHQPDDSPPDPCTGGPGNGIAGKGDQLAAISRFRIGWPHSRRAAGEGIVRRPCGCVGSLRGCR